jgi:hypothetical protein
VYFEAAPIATTAEPVGRPLSLCCQVAPKSLLINKAPEDVPTRKFGPDTPMTQIVQSHGVFQWQRYSGQPSMKLALMTVGVLYEPFGHARVQGFVDRISAVFEAADVSDGFIDHSERGQEFSYLWGEIMAPKCYGMPDEAKLASTLSIWEDIESVAAFAYHGPHGEAMAKRKEWFETHDAPAFVAWWVEDGRQIDWKEACERLDHLHENGPTAFAFNFAMPFDASGRPAPIRPAVVREKISSNANR